MPFTSEDLERIQEYKKGYGVVGKPITVDIDRERREPEGTLMKTFDYLLRPLYASAAFSRAIVENKPIEEAFRASIRGVSGKERVFYSDVLKSAGVKNKYVRAIGGLALDIGLDPITYLSFGAGAGAELGLTTLNKSGKILLTRTLKRQLPKLIERNLGVTADKVIVKQMARETIEEAVLRMALKEPQKYIAQPALRIFGKKIPVVSDIVVNSTKFVGKGIGKVPGMEFIREKPMRWFGEAFIGDSYIIKHSKHLTMEQKNLLTLAHQQAKTRILLGGELAMERATKMAEQIPKLADRELISNAIEQAAKRNVPLSSLVPEHLATKADDVQRFIFKEITEPEAQRGLLRTFREGYVPHYYKKGMAGFLSKDIPHPIIARNRFGQSRIFKSIEEAKNAGWQPIEDVAVTVGLRNAYSKRIIAIDDYVQKMLSSSAKPLSKKSSEWKSMLLSQRVPEGMGIYIPRGAARFYPLYNSGKTKTIQMYNAKAIQKLFKAEGTGGFFGGELLKELRLTPVKTAFEVSDDIPVYLLPKEIAGMMNKASPYLTSEKGIAEFLKLTDDILRIWKTSVTSWWPGFHSRNAMSNVWLSFLGGLKNPMRYYDAARLQRYDYAARRGKPIKDFVVKLGGKNYKASELVKMGKRTEVLYRGWFGAELGETVEREIFLKTGIRPRIGELTAKQRGKEMARGFILEKPRAIGTAIENNARFALFLDQINKGFDIASAARHTKKFLFDYGELTTFEKGTMRRLFPFYTWIRKNLPLEVEQLFRQPGKFALIGKTKEEVESLSERPDERYLPDWMREQEVFLRLPWEGKDKPLYVNFDFAFQDLAKLTLSKGGWEIMKEAYGYLRPDIKALPEILTNYNVYFGRNISDPDLPTDVKFRKAIKEEFLSSLRIAGYMRRFSKEDVPLIYKLLDFALGLKPYPYDEAKSRYWYFQRKERERRALRKEQLKKMKK